MKRSPSPSTPTTPSQDMSTAEPLPKKIRLEDGEAKPTVPNRAEDEKDKIDRKKAKKAKKAGNKALIDSLPTFSFDGNELKSRTTPIGIDELRTLILAIMTNTPIPRWLVVKNPKNIKRFVVLNIPGITPDLLDMSQIHPTAVAYPIALPNTSKHLTALHKLFSHACPSKAPGDATRLHSVLSCFLTAPVSAEEKARRVKERNKQQTKLSKVNDPANFCLTQAEMAANGYNLPSYMPPPPMSPDASEDANGWSRIPPGVLGESWVETPELDSATDPPKEKVWAIDCEMIETTAGRELGRVSVVDFDNGLVIFDSLVKPTNPITSYLTAYSGLTEDIMSEAKFTLPEIQKQLMAPGMIDGATILLGHSLENDLRALQLSHPRVIDTAIIYHHTKGPPSKPGLKWLAQKWLGKQIQTSDKGHDSREDATTCVELLKKKMEQGYNFGRYDHDLESIFETMARQQKKSAYVGTGCNAFGGPATTKLECDDDEKTMDAVIANISSHDFIFARLQELSFARLWATPYQSSQHKAAKVTLPPPPPLDATLERLDKQIKRLHQSLPAYTALCIFTGHSDARRMSELNKKKAAWDSLTRMNTPNGQAIKAASEIPKDQWWTANDGRELENETELARKGLVFFCITLPKIVAGS
ncbi:hypothetical protein FRC02_003398 [Tulasnella sp. 418]|nr:hypothetical protein FRC02_003398 [Tulasnella sp. 418]